MGKSEKKDLELLILTGGKIMRRTKSRRFRISQFLLPLMIFCWSHLMTKAKKSPFKADIKINLDDYLPGLADLQNFQIRTMTEASKQKALWEENATSDFTFEDLKKRITEDAEMKFDGSAWFGGTSPFHHFHSDCFYALGSSRANPCIFQGTARPGACTRKPFDDVCGESFLPGCWHGSSVDKKGKQHTSLACYPLARSSYAPYMLPPDKKVRREATMAVVNHIMKTVKKSFDNFKSTNTAFLKKGSIRPLLFPPTTQGGTVDMEKIFEFIVEPKDAFWNIFTDFSETAASLPSGSSGGISLCLYFARASLGKIFPNGGTDAQDAIKKCVAATKSFAIPPLCFQNFEP